MSQLTLIEQIPAGKTGDTCVFGKHQVNTETPWEIPWTIVHRDTELNMLTLFADNIIDLRAFDAKEPNNTDNNRKIYGNNRYRYSNIHKWLNSSEPAGSWYTAQHSYDSPPSTTDSIGGYGTQYQARPGFLYNFSSEERAMLGISSIMIDTATVDGGTPETIEGTVFLPSCNNLNIENSELTPEGDVFEYFIGASNSDRIAHMQQEAFENTLSSSKPSTSTTAWYYWLRSSNAGNSNDVRGVSTGGGLSGNNAYHGYYGVRPCLYIPMQTVVNVLDKMIVLPSASAISYLSPVRTLTGPDKMCAAVVDLVLDGSSVQVFACNNAYDESPTWENVTTYVNSFSTFFLENRTKTADSWGFQLKVLIDKADAPWVHSRGVAFVVLDEEE